MKTLKLALGLCAGLVPAGVVRADAPSCYIAVAALDTISQKAPMLNAGGVQPKVALSLIGTGVEMTQSFLVDDGWSEAELAPFQAILDMRDGPARGGPDVPTEEIPGLVSRHSRDFVAVMAEKCPNTKLPDLSALPAPAE